MQEESTGAEPNQPGEPERLATVILTRTLSGPGTQRGTGVHTNGTPGPNQPVQSWLAAYKRMCSESCSNKRPSAENRLRIVSSAGPNQPGEDGVVP